MIAHVLIAVVILCIKIGFLLTSRTENIEIFLSNYFYLSSSWEALFYKPWTLVSYFFMPESIFSLIANLAVLHLFARIIISLLGSRRFLTLYFLGGISGGLFFLLLYTLAPLFQEIGTITIHFPVATYAVIIATTTFAPNFLFHRFLLPIPIKYVAGFLMLQPLVQLANGEVSAKASAIAQLGSALFGYLYIHYLKYMAAHPSIAKHIQNLFKAMEEFFDPSPKKKKKDTSPHAKPPSPKTLQAIFDKIASKGYHSLSEEEKEQFFNESENEQN